MLDRRIVETGRFDTQDSLMAKLRDDIYTCEKPRLIIFAGHLPVTYEQSQNSRFGLDVVPQPGMWGAFSEHTFELGCDLGKFALLSGKEPRIAVFVDDHTYEPDGRRSKVRTARKRFYQQHSETGHLFDPYHGVLYWRGLSSHYVLQHNQKREGREESPLWSEKLLRGGLAPGPNTCTVEYARFLEGQVDPETTQLLAFVPVMCRDNVCQAVAESFQGLEATHVFMETDEVLKPNARQLYEGLSRQKGVLYRRDG